MIRIIKGFRDILPGEVELWQRIEAESRGILEDFGHREIRVPIMEQTRLFARSIGEDTDIVEKEMYTFEDRGGDFLTLRPEATASICRSYIQNKMYAQDPVRKFYTVGPMFRRERPQRGRYRQFYQIDAEIFGIEAPEADVQIIYMLVELFSRLDVGGLTAHVNTLGCPECRPAYKAKLLDFIQGRAEGLCDNCLRRAEANPLRVLDCKSPRCQEAATGAPDILDNLCPSCEAHFSAVTGKLGRLGVNYVRNPRLVRGLDYYTRTTFEILTTELGAQNAVAGGGRYDGLVEELGGPHVPATGFAIGFDRLAEIMGAGEKDFSRSGELYIAAAGDRAREWAFEWMCKLARAGVQAETDLLGRSLKSQMKRADKEGYVAALVVGDDELDRGVATLRLMAGEGSWDIPLDDPVPQLARLVKALKP
ncbi:MAG: histidine--tRNA ligase [Desulfatibacillaceae bacterium]